MKNPEKKRAKKGGVMKDHKAYILHFRGMREHLKRALVCGVQTSAPIQNVPNKWGTLGGGPRCEIQQELGVPMESTEKSAKITINNTEPGGTSKNRKLSLRRIRL